MDGVFVGSGIFKSGDPAKRARAIVQVSKIPVHVNFLQNNPMLKIKRPINYGGSVSRVTKFYP